MARARGVRSQLAGVFEQTEKTAPTTGYTFLPNLGNDLGRSAELLPDDIVGTRDPGDADLDSPMADGSVSIPIDLNAIGFWLKGLLGAPTTTDDTGVYTHVFKSGSWSLPSIAIERQMPDVPSYEMFVGARVNRLSYSMQRTGRLNGSVELMAQGANAPAGASAAGTPGAFTVDRFMQKQGTASIAAAVVGDMVACDFQFTNNLDPVEVVTADGFIGGLDPLRPELSGTLRLRFSSESLFTTAKAGTPVALALTHTIGADKSLTLEMPRVFLSVPKRPVEGAQGVEASFSWQAARATDGGPMLTATLINGVSAY